MASYKILEDSKEYVYQENGLTPVKIKCRVKFIRDDEIESEEQGYEMDYCQFLDVDFYGTLDEYNDSLLEEELGKSTDEFNNRLII